MLLAATMGLTACSSDSDIKEPETPVTPVTPTTPSTVDSKKWELDQYMDTVNYKPGNDFAMYCWGKWYQSAQYGDGMDNEMNSAITQREAALDNKYHTQLVSELNQLKANDEDGLKSLRAEIAQMEAYAKENTPEAAWKAVAQYLASGRSSVFSLAITGDPQNTNKAAYYLQCSAQLSQLDNTWARPSLEALGYSEEEIKEKLACVGISEEDGQDSDADGEQQAYRHADVRKGVKGVQMAATRAGSEAAQILSEATGIPAGQLYLNTDGSGEMIELVSAKPYDICQTLACAIAEDALLVMPSLTAKQKADGKDNLMKEVDRDLVAYEYSKEYCDKYVTTAMHDKLMEMMEEMRSVLLNRIDSSTWMTDSKEKAKEKLKAMVFEVFYPDQWYSEALPTLEGKSLLEDVRTLRQARWALAKKLATTNSLRNEQLTLSYAQLSTDPEYTTAATNNAFNVPEANAVMILPANFQAPQYSEDMSDAYLFAVMAIIGHELTHGFDTSGILYDATGQKSGDSWLSKADLAAFEKLGKRLEDCFNKIPYGPESGTMNDGQKTLPENIADLGGMEIALEAYTNRLVKEGYTGDELIKQQKRLFQAVANQSRGKNTEEMLTEAYGREDEQHASDYSRIIGRVKNMDKWYELYGVKEGDKHYVKPEERVHIW